jgi:LacI family transcriptional regulator
MERTSLRTIARKVGVAPCTVSRVLRNDVRCYVSQAKKEAIFNAARECDYSPHQAARSLALRKSFNIGFVLCDLARLDDSGPLTPRMIDGIHRVLTPAGYLLSFVTIPWGDADALKRVCSAAQTYDGLIFPVGTVADEGGTGILASSRVPFISVGDNRPFLGGYPRVLTDKAGAFSRIVLYLKELGHNDLAFYGQPGAVLDMFFDGCRENSLIVRSENVHLFTARNFYEVQMTAYLAADPLLAGTHTAVVCGNDFTALGLCGRLKKEGIRVGLDVSVTGFDDIEALLGVREDERLLTTVHKPQAEMGEAAARLLLERIADPETSPREELLPCQLVVRTSTGPIS